CWWNDKTDNQGVCIANRRRNACSVSAVGNIQFGCDQLMCQGDQTIASCRRIEDRAELRVVIRRIAEGKRSHRPHVGVVSHYASQWAMRFPESLGKRTTTTWVTRQGFAPQCLTDA